MERELSRDMILPAPYPMDTITGTYDRTLIDDYD